MKTCIKTLIETEDFGGGLPYRLKVLYGLEQIADTTQRSDMQELMEGAIDLLKKQEPVEVIHHEAPYGYPYNTGKCPVCFQQLDEGDKFCRECGQAVKWDV